MRNIAKSQRLTGVLALLFALALAPALALVALAALAVLTILGHHVLEVFGVGLVVVAFIVFVVVVIVAVGRTRGARARHTAAGRAAGRAAARRRRLGRPRRPLGVGRVFGNGLLVLGLAADVPRLARSVLRLCESCGMLRNVAQGHVSREMLRNVAQYKTGCGIPRNTRTIVCICAGVIDEAEAAVTAATKAVCDGVLLLATALVATCAALLAMRLNWPVMMVAK